MVQQPIRIEHAHSADNNYSIAGESEHPNSDSEYSTNVSYDNEKFDDDLYETVCKSKLFVIN